MKILEKIKRRSILIGILFAMLIVGIVYAADYYQVNSGAQATIDEWSVCKKVTNNNALAIFVPTKTEAEWTAFRTYASGVTYADCCSANGVACSSDANCCSAICGTDADGDNYFSLAAGHTGTCQATSKPYTDCNDNDATRWRLRYKDSDGDGHCPSSTKYCVGNHSGYRDSCSSYNDCCDTDSRAYPGTYKHYTSVNNCGSWDYNCDGQVSKVNGCSGNTQCQMSFYQNYPCGSDCVLVASGRGCTPITPIEVDCGQSWTESGCNSINCATSYTPPCTSIVNYTCVGTARTCSCN